LTNIDQRCCEALVHPRGRAKRRDTKRSRGQLPALIRPPRRVLDDLSTGWDLEMELVVWDSNAELGLDEVEAVAIALGVDEQHATDEVGLAVDVEEHALEGRRALARIA
jgi:hypothetical protein